MSALFCLSPTLFWCILCPINLPTFLSYSSHIQKWNGHFFWPVTLTALGYFISLGHHGQSCPHGSIAPRETVLCVVDTCLVGQCSAWHERVLVVIPTKAEGSWVGGDCSQVFLLGYLIIDKGIIRLAALFYLLFYSIMN